MELSPKANKIAERLNTNILFTFKVLIKFTILMLVTSTNFV